MRARGERADLRVVELFTGDATYRSHVFREPHEGHDEISAYWNDATATQSGVRALTGEPLVDGDRVVAEWWTTMTEEEGPVTLPGVLVLDFDGDRCRALREYCAYQAGSSDLFPEWGRFEPGEGGRAHAVRGADAYERAWSAGNAVSAASLYGDDVATDRTRSASPTVDTPGSSPIRRPRTRPRSIARCGSACQSRPGRAPGSSTGRLSPRTVRRRRWPDVRCCPSAPQEP
jgi:hypothetical protein